MKAIILAAGKGSRISDKIGGIPKSTLKLEDGTPLIRREVINMLDRGIMPIVCVGYKKELIIEALRGLDVKYYHNPFYSITNNIVSLWFAQDEFGGTDDILLTSADLYYPGVFLDMCSEAEGDVAMTVDSSRIESGDFYFSVKQGIIQEYGPNTPLVKRNYEYMGLTKIKKDFAPYVKGKIVEYINTEKFDRYFEDMIISMNMSENKPINFIDVKGSFWREFDFYDDYLAILDYEREERK